VSTEARRLLRAWLERTGARLDALERRFASLERVVFEIDGIARRLVAAALCPERHGAGPGARGALSARKPQARSRVGIRFGWDTGRGLVERRHR
jgi:hypothetical protein